MRIQFTIFNKQAEFNLFTNALLYIYIRCPIYLTVYKIIMTSIKNDDFLFQLLKYALFYIYTRMCPFF